MVLSPYLSKQKHCDLVAFNDGAKVDSNIISFTEH